MNENRNIKCAPSGRNQSWTSIDWNKAEETVKKLQARIVKKWPTWSRLENVP